MHVPLTPPVLPMCAVALFAQLSPSVALHCGVCPPVRRNPPSANAYAGHIPCRGADSAALQWPLPVAHRQNAALSALDGAFASHALFPQLSIITPALHSSIPALPASYRSTPAFMMTDIILRSEFPVIA